MTSYQRYLHRQALKTASQFRKIESELLELLQKIDKQKVYRQLGYSSLFVYATQELRLTEAVAYSFIQVARKAKEIPELKTAIVQGELTVSKAKRVVSVLTPQNQDRLLSMAKTLPKREIEKEVAKISPKEVVHEKARYVAEERLELKLGVSESLMKTLRRAQDVLSSKKRRGVDLEEVLTNMAEEFLERHDPIGKAKRAEKNPGARHGSERNKGGNLGPGTVSAEMVGCSKTSQTKNDLPTTLPAKVRHTVMLRDQGQCSFVDRWGQRCNEGRWLEFHHQKRRALGGEDVPDNLVLLCHGHHQAMHDFAPHDAG